MTLCPLSSYQLQSFEHRNSCNSHLISLMASSHIQHKHVFKDLMAPETK